MHIDQRRGQRHRPVGYGTINTGLNLLGILLAVGLCWVVCSYPAQAQQLPGTSGVETPAQETVLPADLTREVVRDLLSGLSDAQARELLLQELDEKVAAREAAQVVGSDRPIGQVVRGWAVAIANKWYVSATSIPRLPAAFAATFERYKAARGDVGFSQFWIALFAALAAGVVGAFTVRRLMRRHEDKLYDLRPESLWQRIWIISIRFLAHGSRVAAFLIVSNIVGSAMTQDVPADQIVVLKFVTAVGWTLFALMVARFMLSPYWPELRLCAANDTHARFLSTGITVIFGWSAFGIGFFEVIDSFGWPEEQTRFGFWLGVILHLLIIGVIWRGREGIRQMVLGDGSGSQAWTRFAYYWPVIAIGFVIAEFMLLEVLVATGAFQYRWLTAMNVTLATVLALPLIVPAIDAVVRALWPAEGCEEAGLKAAQEQTQAGLIRCGRIIAAFSVVILLAKLWGLDLHNLAAQGVGAQLAGVLLEILLIIILAYGMGEFINIIAKRQLAMEQAAALQSGGGATSAGMRLATVIPLLKGVGFVIISVLTILAILGQMGVNVVPLLAGAGIAGVAIGFGAQALVKDVLSGVFFLIDDAFRKGEYIDIDTAMGTVESISIRSMQLRHHDGLLYTVPFGEIRQVMNYSRDWGIMRLLLRVPYDTDVKRLAKLIDELGEELMDDPEIGKMLTKPMKAQGVVETDDSAMIFRVAFLTKALDQYAVRGAVYARIREMFEREGIKFANRAVTVHIAGHENGEPLSEAEREAVSAAARDAVAAQDDAAAASKPVKVM